MSVLKTILGLGAVLVIVQLLLGLDMFFRESWALVWPHVGVGAVLFITLVVALILSKPYRRVRMHTAVTLVLVIFQGLVGFDMLMRGPTEVMETLHLVVGFLTAGSYLGTYAIARRAI